MIRYAQKVYDLGRAIDRVRDARKKPRIPTGRIVRAILLMEWARIGSLYGLDRCRPGGAWGKWLGGPLPSDDRIGDVAAMIDPDALREMLGQLYAKRRRNRSLRALCGQPRALIFDGHETPGSYLRRCEGCLTRIVETKRGKHIQYYHRDVTAMLLHEGGQLLLDNEPQRPGEGEMAAAMRLLDRLLARFPRAFDVVAGDALYLNPSFCRLALDHGKDFIAVLKNENRDLIADARSLLGEVEPTSFLRGKTRCECWDIEGFTTWRQLGRPVRVVRSVETRAVRRQRSGKTEEQTSEWLWGTSLPRQRASTRAVVRLGHGRWRIENNGFNELVNEWHGDHIYRHDPNALVVFRLLLFVAYNLFHAFVRLNLKPAIRAGRSVRHWAHVIHAEFYTRLGAHAHPP